MPPISPAPKAWRITRASPLLFALVACDVHRAPAASARVDSPAVATRDSVLLARDFDGDGGVDSLVIEQKPGECDALCSRRAALYLDGATRPAWVSPWDDEDSQNVTVLASLTASPTATLLALDSPLADYDAIWIVRVSSRAAVTIGEHGIDYGQGDFALTHSGDTILVRAAPADHLRLRGVGRVPSQACAPAAWSGVEARFDVRSGTFVDARSVCIAPRSP